MLKVREPKPNVRELTLDGELEKDDIESMERERTPALQGDRPFLPLRRGRRRKRDANDDTGPGADHAVRSDRQGRGPRTVRHELIMAPTDLPDPKRRIPR